MRKALYQTLVAILSSKKAVTAIIAGITAGGLRLGLDVDSETVGLIVAPLITLIIGQSHVDRGKTIAAETAAKGGV